MPYSLFELTQMSREQLESAAQELQIKVTKKMTDEDLSYEILDAQANAAALEPFERPKTKRGRPKKTESQPKKEVTPEAPKQEDKPQQEVETKAEEKPKAKRGRKPKSAQQTAPAEAEAKPAETVEIVPDAAPVAPQTEKTSSKRGRKPKNKQAQQDTQTAVQQPNEAKPEPEQKAVPETATPKPVDRHVFIHALFDGRTDDPGAQVDHDNFERKKTKC